MRGLLARSPSCSRQCRWPFRQLRAFWLAARLLCIILIGLLACCWVFAARFWFGLVFLLKWVLARLFMDVSFQVTVFKTIPISEEGAVSGGAENCSVPGPVPPFW